MRFTKMQAMGNDFIVINNTMLNIKLTAQQIKKLAHRNFGIGFDQLLIVENNLSNDADFNYLIYNSDGTVAEQCSNGARCFAKFVYQKGLIAKKNITAKTVNKIIAMKINKDNTVTVNMGQADFTANTIIKTKQNTNFYKIANLKMGLVNMGNPHAVIIVNDLDSTDVKNIGHKVQQDKSFIHGVNVNFVQIIKDDTIALKVFERGVGETMSCGSGACATVAFLHKINKVSNAVNVKFAGGNAKVVINNDIYLSGTANFVFEGNIDITNLP